MPAARTSLLDFVTAFYERCLIPWRGGAWEDPEAPLHDDNRWWAAEIEGAFAAALECAWSGDYSGAHEAAVRACAAEGDLVESHLWQPLLEACELAERVDSFLAVLEASPAAGLARSCREDVRALSILADWCDDNAQPAAAAEARHLHNLLQLFSP
jgi:hypothetical protein